MNTTETLVQMERSDDPTIQRYTDALIEMAKRTDAEGDVTQSSKFRELADKWERGVLTIAFCGHFSAGKSTLVNALCGENLLPSSPIPTSANVVVIRNGPPGARVEFRAADGSVTVTPDLPVNKLGDYAVDGEGVSAIDVTYPVELLGDRMALVDTPGVDSTDGAHRAATESALHLADVVFYVTDYNHVLSDVNFRFLRTLHQWGKPTYLLVNQIDKHRESEVSFSAFREGIVDALSAWRIEPAGVLFLSLRDRNHPLSQFDELITTIESLKPMTEQLLLHSTERSVRYLAEQYRETIRQRTTEERELMLERAGGELALQALAETHERLMQERDAAAHGEERYLEKFKNELDRLLGNANLTPAETREKAREVLESLQPGFKVGWLGSAAKTEAERERRLQILAVDFIAQVEANLHNHVSDLLRREGGEIGVSGTEWEEQLDQSFPKVTMEWIRSIVKPGAGADGQATLHYTSELSAGWKAIVRKQAMALAEKLAERRRAGWDEQSRVLDGELKELAVSEQAAKRIKALDEEEKHAEAELLAIWPEGKQDESITLRQIKALNLEPSLSDVRGGNQHEGESGGAREGYGEGQREGFSGGHLEGSSEGQNGSLNGGQGVPATTDTVEEPMVSLTATDGGAAAVLGRGAALLEPFTQLRKQSELLSNKADQLRQSRFTIALFGAFSAGKSSFANALVGQNALPVSPNPTTATINRIVAPADGAPHGSALIAMKSREAMLEDLAHSLERLGVESEAIKKAGEDVSSLFALSSRMTQDDIHPRGRPHLAFLRAAASGWSEYGDKLGQSFVVDHASYRRYVAEEEASCFVASIDLHIDSPLTRSGAVLVDTPGADSINARHTGVAFEYIKNADAVLFVTYYNHAFTEADRGFLNQLGSVKDAFELDKMFFVLNAADLASSQEELQGVLGHVESQLLKHGIRRPRLYPISSLKGLEAKQNHSESALQTSGLTRFEAAFQRFAQEELGGLALASARKQLERIGTLIGSLLASAGQDASTREARTKRMLESAAELRARWEQDGVDTAMQPLVQELGEQLYHLRRRVQYRFGEHFLSAFHPSILQDDGRDLKKLIQACCLDLQRSVGEDLKQELRSAGLRLEVALQRRVTEKITEGATRAELEGFEPESPDKPSLGFPSSDPFGQGPAMDAKRLWGAFRSPKHFFEAGGSKPLREELEGELFRDADKWLDSVKAVWKERLEAGYGEALASASESMLHELEVYARGLAEELIQPGAEQALSRLNSEWTNLVNSISLTHSNPV